MAEHLERGQAAEALAARYLRGQGLRPVTANYRSPFGELDLVMTDRTELVVIEVRFRERTHMATPADTITMAKRRRLVRATEHFLQRTRRFADWPVRFDVVAVSGSPATPAITWLRAAFTLDDVAAG